MTKKKRRRREHIIAPDVFYTLCDKRVTALSSEAIVVLFRSPTSPLAESRFTCPECWKAFREALARYEATL